MKDYNKADKYFNKTMKKILNAETTNELLNIDMFKYSKGLFNKKFKGNFNKCKDYCIKECNTHEHNYFQY
jgi:hypothetical protein